MAQRGINGALNARRLAAEVASLREGREAIEERARHELNMVRDGEVFSDRRSEDRAANTSQPSK